MVPNITPVAYESRNENVSTWKGSRGWISQECGELDNELVWQTTLKSGHKDIAFASWNQLHLNENNPSQMIFAGMGPIQMYSRLRPAEWGLIRSHWLMRSNERITTPKGIISCIFSASKSWDI